MRHVYAASVYGKWGHRRALCAYVAISTLSSQFPEKLLAVSILALFATFVRHVVSFMAHAAEAAALRTDMAACLRALSGDTEPGGPGVEALLATFVERSTRLQRAFAVAAMREAGRGGDSGNDVAALRSEVDMLRRELAEKDALLTTHRANVERWLAECHSVQQMATSSALEPQTQ